MSRLLASAVKPEVTIGHCAKAMWYSDVARGAIPQAC